VAVFHVASLGESMHSASQGWYATQNVCPHKRQMVLARGIVGDQAGAPKVACPLHKKTFDLRTGACLSGDALEIETFPVRVDGGHIFVELPPAESMDTHPPCPDVASCAAEAVA
jgi:NAD(P)H-dependent nitrite reductase small subunit